MVARTAGARTVGGRGAVGACVRRAVVVVRAVARTEVRAGVKAGARAVGWAWGLGLRVVVRVAV